MKRLDYGLNDLERRFPELAYAQVVQLYLLVVRYNYYITIDTEKAEQILSKLENILEQLKSKERYNV